MGVVWFGVELSSWGDRGQGGKNFRFVGRDAILSLSVKAMRSGSTQVPSVFISLLRVHTLRTLLVLMFCRLFRPMRSPLTMGFVCAMMCLSSIAVAQSTPTPNKDDKVAPLGVTAKVEQALMHGWTYYWVGMIELGDVRSFEMGLTYVDAAESLLKHESNTSTNERARSTREIEALRDVLNEQKGLAEITLRGNFPLTAFLGKSILVDATSLGTYEIVDEPYDAAVTQMAEILRDDILGKWGMPVQTHVLVISDLPSHTFENKVNFLVARAPRVNIIPLEQVQNRLEPAVYDALNRGSLDGTEGLHQRLGVERLLVVRVQRADVVDDLHFYTLDATTFDQSAARTGRRALLKRSVVRDRRDRHMLVIVHMALMLLLALGVMGWLVRGRFTPVEILALGVACFVCGEVTPQLLVAFLEPFEPQEEELLKLAFWWPMLAGLASTLGPSVVFIILGNRLGAGVALLRKAAADLPSMAIAIGLGTGAYLSRGAIVYLDVVDGGVLAWAMAAGCVGIARWVALGRVGKLPQGPRLWIAAVGFLVFPFAAFGASWLWTTLSAAALLGSCLVRQGVVHDAHASEGEDAGESLDDGELEALIGHARRPSFVSLEPFSQACAMLEAQPQTHGRWIMLQGQKGSGKSTTAGAMVKSLGDVVLLKGVCPAPTNEDLEGDGDGHEAKPYEVFVQALGDSGTFGFEAHGHDVFSELEDTVLDALPLVSLLMPGTQEDGPRAVSDRGEIYARIEQELIRQTRKNTRTVVVWLDDIQWMDNASQGVLDHLIARFGADAKHRIVFVMCGRHLPINSPMADQSLDWLSAHEVCVELDAHARRQVLTDAVGFDAQSSRVLDDAMIGSEGRANMAWLLTLVETVAQEGVVRRDDDQWRLTVEHAHELPVPKSFIKLVAARFDALDREDQHLLKVATALGATFRIEVLCAVTERSRLHVLDALDRLAAQTNLIEDDISQDDLYQFVSAQRYVALRAHLSLQELHPHMHAPQTLRDLHHRIAQSLEALWRTSRADVSDVAHHHYNAGRRDLPSAVHFCQRAARAALDVFAYDNAAFQLRRAQICAEMLVSQSSTEAQRAAARERLEDIELQLRLLPFERAHVLGLVGEHEELIVVARRLFAPVQAGTSTLPSELLIVMTRACYDAREFALALDMAEHLITAYKAEQGSIPHLAYVEGMHFKGLSLDPRQEAPQRLVFLERAQRALDEVEAHALVDEERADASLMRVHALQGRVYNSLGEQLSQRQTYTFDDARAWFERSIKLKQAAQPTDKPGLARAHGGLGRLYLYADAEASGLSDPQRLELACSEFEQDLQLCQDYGDVAGQCQMHSHLGDVALQQDRPEDSRVHYNASLEFAQSPISQAFALIGLYNVAQSTDDRALHHSTMESAATLAAAGSIPTFLNARYVEMLTSPWSEPQRIPQYELALDALGVNTSSKEEE